MADDDDSNHPLGAGMASILRMTGFNIPSRAIFIGEAMISASLSSLTIGMVCGAAGAATFPVSVGPLVPYMVGSSFGFTFGMWQYWNTCKKTTLWYARNYPSVLAHAIRTDREQGTSVPTSVVKASEKQLILSLEGQDEEDQHKDQEKDNNNNNTSTKTTTTTTTTTLEEWIKKGGLGRMTWSILAAQQCRSDVLAIQRQERQRIVDVHSILVGPHDDNESEED